MWRQLVVLCAVLLGSLFGLYGLARADVVFMYDYSGIVAKQSFNMTTTWNVFAQLSSPPLAGQRPVALKYDQSHRILWWSTASLMGYCPIDSNWYCTTFYNVTMQYSDVYDFDIDQRDGSAYFFASSSRQLFKALSPRNSTWKDLDSSQVFSLMGTIPVTVPASKYAIAIYTEKQTAKTWLYSLRESDNIFEAEMYLYRSDISDFPSSLDPDLAIPVFSYQAGHAMKNIRMNFDKSTGVLYFHDSFIISGQPNLFMMPTDPLPSPAIPTVFKVMPATQTTTYSASFFAVYCIQPAAHWSVEVTSYYLWSFTFHNSFAGSSSLPGFGSLSYTTTIASPYKTMTNEATQGGSQVVTAFDDKLVLATAFITETLDPNSQAVGIISSRSGYNLAARHERFVGLTNPSVRLFLNTSLTDPDLGEISPQVLSLAVDNNAGVIYWSNQAREIWAFSIDGYNSSLVIKDSSHTFSSVVFDYRYRRLFAVVDLADHVAVLSLDTQSYTPLTVSQFAQLISLAIYHRQGIMFILTRGAIYRGAVPMAETKLPIPNYDFCEEEPNCGYFTQIATAPNGLMFRSIAVDQTKGLLWVVTSDGIVRLLNSITCPHFECKFSPVFLNITNTAPFDGKVMKLAIEEQQIPQYTTLVNNLSNGVRIDGRKVSLNSDEMFVITEDGQVHSIVHYTSTVDSNDVREVLLSTFISPSSVVNNTLFNLEMKDVATVLYPHFNVSQLLHCTGTCSLFCPPGYTPSEASCVICPINTAKNSSGTAECSLCRTYLWPLSYEDVGNITCADHLGDELALVFSFTGILVFLLVLCLLVLLVIIIIVILGVFATSRKKKTPKDEPGHSIMPPINEDFKGKASIRVDTTGYDVSVDEFKILQKIGSGTYSNVYKAEYRGDIVALKKLNLASVTDETSSNTPGAAQTDEVKALTSEFEHEASLLATLRHKNIVSFVAAVTVYPNYAIATEFMDMGSLFDILKRVKTNQQQLNWNTKLHIAHDVSKGMEYLHHNNLIHRDLKSPNILLDSKFTAKVSDFGLSRMKEKAASVMTANVGSPLWLAPEVTLGLQYDNKCDVFSFGVVLWELLTNEQPYYDFTGPKIQIHMKVATDQTFRPKIPPSSSTAKTDEGFLALMQRCWVHDSAKRPTFTETTKTLSTLIK